MSPKELAEQMIQELKKPPTGFNSNFSSENIILVLESALELEKVIAAEIKSHDWEPGGYNWDLPEALAKWRGEK